MATYTKRTGQRGTRWEARIRKKGYPTKTKTFSLKADAENWAIHTERSLERGNYNCEVQSLGDVLKQYANDVTPNKRGAEQELFRIGKLLRNSLSNIRLSELKATDIVKYRDQRLHEVTPTSVLKELILLNHCLDTAKKEWGVNLPINALHDVRRPKPNPQRDRRLDVQVFKQLLISCSEERVYWFYPLIIFAIETGMRRGEIFELRWQDIDLDKRTAFLSMTKNGTSRTIPLSLNAIETLQSLPRDISGFVFPVSKTALRGLWLRACKRAKIEDFRFHDLRHEATSRFFEKGLNVMEVATITGHRDLRMLQRYTHLRAEDLAIKLG